MGRYRPRDFTHEYARLGDRIRREYGERGYNDKFRVETPSPLRQEEPDYSLHSKQYKAQPHRNEMPSLENAENLEPKEHEQPQKIENSEAMEHFPTHTELHEQQDAYTSHLQSHEHITQLLEHPESAPVEHELLEDHSWDKADELGPHETVDDFISDGDIIRQEKLRKLGHGDCEAC